MLTLVPSSKLILRRMNSVQNRFSDKNSLFDRGSIGEMGLYVKRNNSQYMGILGYPVVRGILRDARACQWDRPSDYWTS